MMQGRISGRRFCLFDKIQTGAEADPASDKMGILSSYPGCEIELPPTSAHVKMKWSYTSAPPKCIHGADRKNILPVLTNT